MLTKKGSIEIEKVAKWLILVAVAFMVIYFISSQLGGSEESLINQLFGSFSDWGIDETP